jgi:hypothetical protein
MSLALVAQTAHDTPDLAEYILLAGLTYLVLDYLHEWNDSFLNVEL